MNRIATMFLFVGILSAASSVKADILSLLQGQVTFKARNNPALTACEERTSVPATLSVK